MYDFIDWSVISLNFWLILQPTRYVRFMCLLQHWALAAVYTQISFLMKNSQVLFAGVVHALKCYGAVLNHLVPNNLKTVIPKHSKDKLILNLAFHLCYCKETGHNCGWAAGYLPLDWWRQELADYRDDKQWKSTPEQCFVYLCSLPVENSTIYPDKHTHAWTGAGQTEVNLSGIRYYAIQTWSTCDRWLWSHGIGSR